MVQQLLRYLFCLATVFIVDWTANRSPAHAMDSSLKKSSSWNWPDNARIVSKLESLLNTLPKSPEVEVARSKSSELQSLRGISLLEGMMSIVGDCESTVGTLLGRLSTEVSSETYPDIESALSSVLSNGGLPDWLKADAQLIVCRSYVQNALYDEAMTRLQSLSIDLLSDPSTYLFNLAVCQHHLLKRDECVESLGRLLEREIDLPTRYAITARLMEADIKPLKEDSLDEISRLMNDVERRLTLGRTGKLVRDKQQAIIDKLDKSIEQLEQQMQQQQQQQQKQKQQDQKNQQKKDPANPMDQSQIAEVKGPGEVDSKDIGNASGWGNLPQHQRQEALQNMTKDLPSHYREVIEAYFKRLSSAPK